MNPPISTRSDSITPLIGSPAISSTEATDRITKPDTRPLRVLLLEDEPRRVARFEEGLNGALLMHTPSAELCLAALRTYPWDVVFLDHDLGHSSQHYGIEYPGNGTMLTMALTSAAPVSAQALFIVHSLNPRGAERMLGHLAIARLNTARCAYAWHEQAALRSLIHDRKWTGPHRSDVHDVEMATLDCAWLGY